MEFQVERKIKCENCGNYVKLLVREEAEIPVLLCPKCAMEDMESGGDD